MKPQYKDHLTEWRPDYPPVWSAVIENQIFNVNNELMSDFMKRRNISAFAIARDAISKAIGVKVDDLK